MGEGATNITNSLLGLVEWGKEKVDQGVEFFGLYTTKYSKLIVYGGLLYILARMLKINLKLGK